MPVTGLIFDKDGTLFDLQATWSGWVAGLARELADDDAALRARIEVALGYDAAAGRLAPDSVVVAETPDRIADALLEALPQQTDRRWLVDKLDTSAAAVPQVQAAPLLPLLDELRARGLVLACVTNDAEEVARVHLREAGVETRFDLILGYDSGHGQKPDPAPMRAVAALCGLAPADIVVIGDNLHDTEAGRAAGMRTVAVLTGALPAEVLAPGADAVLPDIGHLPAWLDA